MSAFDLNALESIQSTGPAAKIAPTSNAHVQAQLCARRASS